MPRLKHGNMVTYKPRLKHGNMVTYKRNINLLNPTISATIPAYWAATTNLTGSFPINLYSLLDLSLDSGKDPTW
jgi:hypothetical protein